MFEYGSEGIDPAKIVVWSFVVPFGLFWAFHRSLLSAFLLQASIISTLSFVVGSEDVRKLRKNINKLWFIKSFVVTVCLVHPLFLTVLWFLDARYGAMITGAGSVFITAFLFGIIEMIVVGEISDHFRFLDAERDN